MKTYKIGACALCLLLVLLVRSVGSAQEATPTPDPLEYDDPAMHYRAPAGAVLMRPIHYPTLDTLTQDPTSVATWVIGNNAQDAKIISITMELYSGSLDGFESTYANGLRGDDSSTLVKSKEHVMLANGMPAMFLDITQGSGFSTHKIFSYIWIDSQRAVVLSAEAMLGSLHADAAQQLLAGATAVCYPGSPACR
jgi:hypothetical protein